MKATDQTAKDIKTSFWGVVGIVAGCILTAIVQAF